MRAINIMLSELFRLHHRELVRFAARLVGDRDNGEEIAQDAYMKVAGRGAEAGAIDHPKSYLFTAARNAAVDFTARRRREWSQRVDLEDLSDLASSEDLHGTVEQRQRLACVAVALNDLPPVCRRIFIMNKIEGRGHQEIAAKLGISVSSVEKHMMRALGNCRDLLRDHEGL